MEQVIIGGAYELLNVATTEYNLVAGEENWDVTEDTRATVISTSGKLKNLRVELNDVPGAGDSYVFTLRRAVGIGAWANTALTCTVGAADTTAVDMVNEVSVAAGDVVCLECNPGGSPAARYAKWTMVFEGDTAKESLLLTSYYSSKVAALYGRPMGASGSGIENQVRCVCPTSGKIKNLYVQLRADPGTAPDAYRITLRIGGVSQLLTCTITADNRTGNDTVNEIAVVAGNVLTVMIEPLETPDVASEVAIGMTFLADTDNESLILGGSLQSLSDTLTMYNHLISKVGTVWRADEAERYQLAQRCTLKNLYMLLSGSPGAGNKYTFTVRRNTASPAGGLVVEIAEAATTGNDTAHTIAVVNDDELDIMVVPLDTPTVREAYWGLVSYRAPRIENKSANMGSKMVAAGLI